MSNRRIPLTIDQHRELGMTLAVMNDELVRIGTRISAENLPKSHPAVRKLSAAYHQLSEARCALGNVLLRDHGDTPGITAHIYYPDPQDRHVRTADVNAGDVSGAAAATGNGPMPLTHDRIPERPMIVTPA